MPIGYDDSRTNVELAGLSVDAAGNLVAAFNTTVFYNGNIVNGPHSLLAAFDADGRFRWRFLTAGSGGFQSVPTFPYARSLVKSVTTTADGGAVATGSNFSDSSSSYAASFVVRTNADGTERYTVLFGNPNTSSKREGLILATSDASDNVFLATLQYTYPPDGTEGIYLLRKLGPNGNVLAQTTNSNIATDTLVQARTDQAGNLYVAGNYRRNRTNANSGDDQAGQLLFAYDANLSLRWRAVGPQPTQTAEDQPFVNVNSLRLSPGGITVAGNTESPALLAASGDRKLEITRYAYANGAVQWHRLYQAPAVRNNSRNESVNGFQVDAADNVYVYGYRSSGPNQFILKYSGVGDTQFLKPLPDADQGYYSDGQTFLLTGNSDRPTFVSEVGKQILVLSMDNPAVVPASGSHPAFFNGETALSNGVYYLSFPSGNYFGYYSYLADPKYVYHFDLGYEYVFDAADGKAGVYLYDFASNTFFYTSPTFPFPYLYDFTLNTVLYYYPDPNNAGHYNTNGVRYFYRFDTGQIFSK